MFSDHRSRSQREQSLHLTESDWIGLYARYAQLLDRFSHFQTESDAFHPRFVLEDRDYLLGLFE